MTHATKHTMRYLFATILSAMALVFSAHAHAQDAGLLGTWVFERAIDFEGLTKNPTTDLPTTLRILGDHFMMPSRCTVRLQREPASTGDVFQSLYKGDVTEDQIATFYQKQFKLNIRDKKAVFRKAPMTDACYRDVGYLLQLGDTLVASEGGGVFSFLYKRLASIQSAAGEGPYSQLPFWPSSYHLLCPKKNTWAGRKPLAGTKLCAPLFYPLVAKRDSIDAIARLVGHHNYEGPAVGGQDLTANDYDNPVESGLRPVYLVFPPKGDITIVYVTDEEGSQNRDAMSGVYLSIRNGKVVSQLNSSDCTMGLDYKCGYKEGPGHYAVNEKGEFVERQK